MGLYLSNSLRETEERPLRPKFLLLLFLLFDQPLLFKNEFRPHCVDVFELLFFSNQPLLCNHKQVE